MIFLSCLGFIYIQDTRVAFRKPKNLVIATDFFISWSGSPTLRDLFHDQYLLVCFLTNTPFLPLLTDHCFLTYFLTSASRGISWPIFPDVFFHQCFLIYLLTNTSWRIFWTTLSPMFHEWCFLTYFLTSASWRISWPMLPDVFLGQ